MKTIENPTEVQQKRQQTIAYLTGVMPQDHPRTIPTEKLAELLEVRPQTIRRGICMDGHYLGLVPLKLPNGRLKFVI